MVGVVGGAFSKPELQNACSLMEHETWYSTWTESVGGYGLGLLHHGERSPHGYTIWQDGDRAVAVHGAITNLHERDEDRDELFTRFLAEPKTVLPELEGPFLVAGVDGGENRVVVATDKLGSRPCYYTTGGGAAGENTTGGDTPEEDTTGEDFYFASELKAIASQLSDPTLDRQAVGDLILMGYLWGDNTLVEEASSLRPASVLVHEDGETTVEPYWEMTFEPTRPGDEYISALCDRYRTAVDRTATTIDGDVGLWLSGGLDSRMTAHELSRKERESAFRSATAYTYDANPPTGKNPRLAKQVAETLGMKIEEITLAPDSFGEMLRESVLRTDGMIRWNTLLNISSVFGIPGPRPNVMMEGLEGALVGHHIFQKHLTDFDSVTDSVYSSEVSVDKQTVSQMLNHRIDPLATIREEAGRHDGKNFAESVLDVHFQNWYRRATLASNQLARSQVDTRVSYVDGDLLNLVAKLPHRYRMRTLPYTDIPFGTSIPKIKMVRQMDSELAKIPYERTNLPPSWPYPAHVAGFVLGTSFERLLSKPTYGSGQLPDYWLRENHRFREQVEEPYFAAAERDLFHEERLTEIWANHMSKSANNVNKIAPVTTVEIWAQEFVD